jgi:hypothetical protein
MPFSFFNAILFYYKFYKFDVRVGTVFVGMLCTNITNTPILPPPPPKKKKRRKEIAMI